MKTNFGPSFKIEMREALRIFCIIYGILCVIGIEQESELRVRFHPVVSLIRKPLGVNLTIRCIVEGWKSKARPQFQWWTDQPSQVTAIYPKGRVSVRQSRTVSQLFFKKLKKSDNGEWECRLVGSGYGKSVKLKLVVFNKITFINPQKRIVLALNSDGFIPCNVHGDPKPRVKWLYNFKTISAKKRKDFGIQQTEEGLQISKVSKEDAGIYTCQASVTDPTFDMKSLNIQVEVAEAEALRVAATSVKTRCCPVLILITNWILLISTTFI